jgi:hypothetical protein
MPKWMMCTVVERLSSAPAPPALAHLQPLHVLGESERGAAELQQPFSVPTLSQAQAEAAEEGSTSSDLAECSARQEFLQVAGRSTELFGRSALLRSGDFVLPALPPDGWMGAADLCGTDGPRLGASVEGLRLDFLEAI